MPPPRTSPTKFYTEVLGAELRNSRWSWGAYEPVNGRLYLRVWEDEVVQGGDLPLAMVLRHAGQPSRGRTERERHLELVSGGVEAYGVLCTPKGPREPGQPREIRDFDRETLIRFGRIVDLPAGRYAEILRRVPVEDLMRPASGAATLEPDLAAIQRQKGLSPTERSALVSARSGQGAFRTAVLAHWQGGCAVTECGVLEAIRASHIKAWRLADNAERLDPLNGLPLVATLDALFDAGLISFQDNGAMLVSERLPSEERRRMRLDGQKLRRRPHERTAVYLAEHRQQFGFGE